MDSTYKAWVEEYYLYAKKCIIYFEFLLFRILVQGTIRTLYMLGQFILMSVVYCVRFHGRPFTINKLTIKKNTAVFLS